MDTWIISMCRKVCIRRLSVWVMAGMMVISVGLIYKRYFVNFFQGPYPASESELKDLQYPDAGERYFLRVVGTKVVDTGVQEFEVTKQNGVETGRRVTAQYYVLKVGERLLLVKSSAMPSLTIEGAATAIPSDVWSNLFDNPKDRSELSPYFLPMLLDADSFRLPGYIGLGVGTLILLLVVFFGRRAWQGLNNPSELRIVQRVQQWGDPFGTSIEIEREFKEGARVKQGDVRLTDKYAVASSWFKFEVFRMRDLVWAYKKVTRHSWNFIPTSKSYNAELIFYGGALDIQGRETKVDAILKYAAEKSPWAVFGYSNELNDLFRKDTIGFSSAVEVRRQKLAA